MSANLNRQGRPRNLFGQLTAVLLQPVTFFRYFPTTGQWLWAGLLILVLVGVIAVRQPSPSESAGNAGAMPPMMLEPEFGDPGIGMPIGGDLGGLPPDMGIPMPGTGAEEATADVSQTTMTALLAASSVVLGWIMQALLLSLVPMFRGFSPKFGRGFQVAVWASVPLALMLVIQLVYYAAGGQGGTMGVALLLESWEGYAQLPEFNRAVLLSLTSQFTLFALWSLALLYFGARHALGGHVWSSLLVVVVWMLIAVLVPVLTGTITAPPPPGV